jgi:tetratricopeptide (TPR) repeat protein
MTSTVERRPALADYPRSETVALGTIELSDTNRAMVLRRRELWSPYLRCAHQGEAAVATQYAPLLLDMILARSGEELPVVPGSHYPHGFRHHVLGHTAFPKDAIGLRLSAEDESGLPFLPELRAMLRPDSDLSVSTLRSLAQLLNVLGLQAVSAKALGKRALDSRDPLLVYEVARSFYVLEPDPDKAVKPFHTLAADINNPLRLRLSAHARLIAHYCRRDRDLGACAEVAESAKALVDSAPTETFEVRMGISRNYRALALYAVRRRNMADIAANMQATIDFARGLSAEASTPTEKVAAAQNERLSLEASLKAFINSKGRAMVIDMEPDEAVDRLLELDQWDPYTRLYSGDTLWMIGQDERALECFKTGATLGTYPGALAAARAGVALNQLGRKEEADQWFAVAVELDPAAAAA